MNNQSQMTITEAIEHFRETQSPGFIDLSVVDKIISGHIYYNGWKWHEDWLELIEDEEEFDIDPDAFESVLLFAKG